MTRFVNSALITIVASFAVLFVLGALGMLQETPAATEPTPSAPPAQPPVAALRLKGIAWGTPGPTGTPILVSTVVANQGSAPLRVDSLHASASLNGQSLGEAIQPPRFVVPAEAASPLMLSFVLPSSSIAPWWQAYGASGENGELLVNGTLQVANLAGASGQQATPMTAATGTTTAQDGATTTVLTDQVPFTWRVTWHGGLLQQLDQMRNCLSASGDGPQPGDAPCLDSSVATWDSSGLVLVLGLRTGTEGSLNGSVALRLDGQEIARAPIAPQRLTPGSPASALVHLDSDPTALQAWWPLHLERCESSSAVAAFDLTWVVQPAPPPKRHHDPPPDNATPVEDENATAPMPDPILEHLRWDMPLGPVSTHIACATADGA